MIPMSREFFINNVVNWMPEPQGNKWLSLLILNDESKGKVKLWHKTESLEGSQIMPVKSGTLVVTSGENVVLELEYEEV